MKIAVYTCVRNEENHVKRWDETTADADYRLWLDTGSTDSTEYQVSEINRRLNDQIEFVSASIKPFRFDVARNTALALLPDDIDICIQLDADEVLSDGWRLELERNPGYERYSCDLINKGNAPWASVLREGIHARHGFRWVRPVHEVLEPRSRFSHYLDGLQIYHIPDEDKCRDYLPLLVEGVAEDPASDRMAFYFARELLYRGYWNAARDAFVRYLSLPSAQWKAERSEAYRYIASIDDYPERWLLMAVAECPERREPWVDLARFYLKEGRQEQAVGAFVSARSRNDKWIYTTSRDAWGEPFDELWEEINSA